ncbi:MAG: histidine kinase [Sulfurimonas sp. RIFOXYD12_FULL_33_39]|uniref:Hpt domain-containing protein n=1 Tax=unclassified Sulfurimonas TaxID=2623549 RepID=UPI0008BE02C7|nr:MULTISPECIES: Hpt domain-containing protein [unclassified Sulfurimonas]OHE01226.1 MAG: histidine kinase [Sulfurimonas sp. RIFCSPLOWO2_12_FULL_34_6]OHE10337.1 MAG: histidine kinase [Sulfurimonas sp. RIFOXYD12_FULL_33_39]OHE13088.1 MAG: histidine kinase [Sulfurimonas sp. RIFOXYD2_FULL_34_21]DAB28357.1 MAG TPA: histidine kinase [Sulfurimonas sp. UBA10385]
MPILNADYSDINHDEMAASIGLKPKHIPLILANFLEETTIILNSIRESIVLKDCDKIRLNAHAIKGSAGNLKFNEIYEMAKEVEFAATEQKCYFEYHAYIDAIGNSINTISI